MMSLLNAFELLASPQETLKLLTPQGSRLVGKQAKIILITVVLILAHGEGPGDLPVGAQEDARDPVLAGRGIVERVRRQGVPRDDVTVQQLLVVDVAVELDGRVLKVARLGVLRVGLDPRVPRRADLELRPGDGLVRDDGDGAPGLGHGGGGLGGVLAVDGRVAR